MPILSGHSHPRNLCILPRLISYALVEQVQQERIFYPFVFAPEAWEVEEPEGLQAFFHWMPGMAANLFKSFLVFLEMTISQSSLGISFGIPFEVSSTCS